MGNIVVNGLWKEGIVLDNHVLHSTPVGYNDYGYLEFDTVRTQLGEIVFKIKYEDYLLKNQEFINFIKEDLDAFLLNKNISYIIGVPPSNKRRQYQPVDMIGEALSEYIEIPYLKDFFIKTDDTYVKNLDIKERKKIVDNIIYNHDTYKLIKDESNILLIDDIYQSGSSLNACTKRLLELNCVRNVFVLALTKTRKG